MPEMVTVHNDADSTFEDAYDGQHFRIEPGEAAIVPAVAASLWFGNPNAVDDTNDRARTREYERLKVRYGASDDEEAWEKNKPTVSVTTVDGETDIPTVINDPKGKAVTPAFITAGDQENLSAILAQQERDLAKIREQIKAELRAELAGEILKDEPPAGPPSKAARKRTTKKATTKKVAAPKVVDAGTVGVEGIPVDAPE